MAETTVLAPHIVQTPGVRGGRPYVEGKGVAVAFVAQASEVWAWSPDTIADEFNLTLAEVHATLAYYWDTAQRSMRAPRKTVAPSRS